MIASHGPILRILTIHRLIQDRRHPNVPGLARLLGVSRRTIQRDIDVLREKMGAPLAFHPVENGFEYTKEGFVLPDVEMTEGEILALLIASTALPGVEDTPAGPLLRELLEKAAKLLGEVRTISPEAIALGTRPISGTGFARLHAIPGVVSTIERALEARATLRIFTGPETGGARASHEVDPYYLASLDGESYLIGYSHRARRICSYRVDRIRAARPTGKSFPPPEPSPEDLLQSILPLGEGERVFEAVLSVDPSLAGPALAHDWGPGCRVQTRMDGGLELSFRSDNGDAVARWSLAWGPSAEVISPPWVRRRTKQLLRQIARRYDRRAVRKQATKRSRRPPSPPPADNPG